MDLQHGRKNTLKIPTHRCIWYLKIRMKKIKMLLIRSARNGCASEITFKEKKVYHEWDCGVNKSYLGKKLNKTKFLKNLVDETNLESVENLMIDWVLYENGWLVELTGDDYKNGHLFYYLTQMRGYSGHRPKELEYFK